MASEFLWVHKNTSSASLSRSESLAERREIHRYVQLERRRRTGVEEEVKSIQRPIVLRTSVGFTNKFFVDAPHHTKVIRKAQRSYLSVAAAKHDTPATLSGTDPKSRNSSDDGDTASTMWSMIKENSGDPFDASSVHIGEPYHTLLQYFINVSHPRTWHAEKRSEGSYKFQPTACQIVSQSIETRMGMFSMLASMASQLKYLEHATSPQEPDILIQNALVATRQHIATNPIDSKLIFGIHSLANSEFYRFNVKAAKIHVCVVKQLIEQIGGLKALDPWLREWYLLGDEFIAAEISQKPLWPASKIDPGPWQGSVESTGHDRNSRHGREPRSWLPSELQDIVTDVKHCLALTCNQRRRQSPRDGLSSPGFGHWLFKKASAIRKSLLFLEFENTQFEAIRLALLAWCYMTNTVTGRRRTMQVIAKQLQALLIESDESDCCPTAQRWVLLVGALASENAAELRTWFLCKLISLSSLLDQADLISILQSFLYAEDVQEPMLYALGLEIQKLSFHLTTHQLPTASLDTVGDSVVR